MARGEQAAKLAKPKGKAAKPVKRINVTSKGPPNGNGLAPTVLVDGQPNSNREKLAQRKENGQLLPGTVLNPAGRPPGAKNKLTEDFITDFHECWKAHGPEALKTMATEEPGAFVRAAVQLMPKDVLLDARGAGLVVVRLDDIDMNL